MNEESYKWLEHNAKLNKTKLKAFNLDGRKFIRDSLGEHLWKDNTQQTKIFVLMNLPALAIEFLDVFKGLAWRNMKPEFDVESRLLPSVNVFCYAFSSDEDIKGDVKKRAEQHLGGSLSNEHTIREVRKVAPGKYMLCLSSEISHSLLFDRHENNQEPDCKRLKVS